MLINMGERSLIRFLCVLLVFSFLCLNPAVRATAGAANANIRCIDEERRALLKFKGGLIDEGGFLSSWGMEEEKKDCCKWRGVQCHNQTGHVVLLGLHYEYLDYSTKFSPLRGKITPSLLALQHLSYLDLSFNDFNTSIPEFIGSLSNLRYLNLSHNPFIGKVPDQLGNLTNLISLDLRGHHLCVRNLEWLSQLSLLRHLDLSGVNLSKAIDWVQEIHKLPFLTDLHLSSCELPVLIPSLFPMTNSSKFLNVLDLSENDLTSSAFHWLFNLSRSFTEIDLSWNNLGGPIPDGFGSQSFLSHLDLQSNELEGGIPKSFGNLSSLLSLDLSRNNLNEQLTNIVRNLSGPVDRSLENLVLYGNQITGSLPDITQFSSLQSLLLQGNRLNGWSFSKSFRQMSNLLFLDLSQNQITGPLPDLTVFSSLIKLELPDNRLNGTLTQSLGQLSKLQYLDASNNSLQGLVTEAHFLNLSNLKHLDLSSNALVLNFRPDWIPPFQLDIVRLKSCKLGHRFPRWLQTQNNFSELDFSVAGIVDTVPTWFWDLPPTLFYLNLSYNQLSGIVPDISSTFFGQPMIDLSSNHFIGPVPQFSLNVTLFFLSRNMFSGPLSSLCGSAAGQLISSLDLSHNQLSGELPDCWMKMELLQILNLVNNNFSGKIPASLGSVYSILQSLHLRNNSFTGELPSTLQNCLELEILDLGENKLSGRIPKWIWTHVTSLVVLSLRMNEFHGSIPSTICQLSSIQILDLSHNNISGNIPKCFHNFTAMTQRSDWSYSTTISFRESLYLDADEYVLNEYVDDALVQWKGKESEYKQTLGLVRSIDLSNNKLTGKIPQQISSLVQLISLNLSRNNLTGNIISEIGQMKMLECLDFSKNQFTGEIPTGLAQLNFLSVLDLSNNKLSGRIPKGTQLQSFNASAYSGNHGLCGLPLPNKCPGDETTLDPAFTDHGKYNNIQEDDDRFITPGFYVSMGLGFALGFWAVFGTLLLNRSWRHAYFTLLDQIKDWFYVKTAVLLGRLKRMLQS